MTAPAKDTGAVDPTAEPGPADGPTDGHAAPADPVAPAVAPAGAPGPGLDDVDPDRPDRAVVLLSGGLDSTVVLWWALHHYRHVTPVTVTWGQATRPEQAAARTIAALAGTPLATVTLTSHGFTVTPGDFTRGHNFSLIGAAGLHTGRDAADILIGSVRSDAHADATARFFNDATAGLAGPRDTGTVRVLAPLLHLDGKPAVLHTGLHLGAPVTRTWSCNRIQRGAPCGQCVSCRDRATAWDTVTTDLATDPGLTPTDITAWNTRLGSWTHPQPRPATGLIGAEMPAILRHTDTLPWRTGHTYPGPDHTTRFTYAATPPARHRRRHHWTPTRYVRVTHPPNPDTGTPAGELILLRDGRVATHTGDDREHIRALAHLIVATDTERGTP